MNYNISDILTNFSGLVKFKTDFEDKDLLNSYFGTSDSGLYFNQGVHGLVTLKNIKSFAQNVRFWDIATFSSDDSYIAGQLVVSATKYYRCIADNDGVDVSDTDFWVETTLFSEWIQREIDGSIEMMLSDVVITTPLVDYLELYRIEDNKTTAVNSSNFVGFEIRPKNSEDLHVIINSVGIQLTTSQSLTLKLYCQNTSVADIVITSAGNEFKWNDLPTKQNLYGSGKRWFLFYDQDDLTGEAATWDFITANSVSNFVDIFPFEVANTTTNFLRDVDGYTAHSYGLGVNLSVRCDLTDFIKKNRLSFAKLLQLKFCYRMIELMYYNSENRTNAIDRNIAKLNEQLLVELKSEEKYSISEMYNVEIQKIKKSLKFDTVCLPCEDIKNIYTNTNFG